MSNTLLHVPSIILGDPIQYTQVLYTRHRSGVGGATHWRASLCSSPGDQTDPLLLLKSPVNKHTHTHTHARTRRAHTHIICVYFVCVSIHTYIIAACPWCWMYYVKESPKSHSVLSKGKRGKFFFWTGTLACSWSKDVTYNLCCVLPIIKVVAWSGWAHWVHRGAESESKLGQN